MEHVLVDNSDYANELREMLFSGERFSADAESGVVRAGNFEFSFSPEFAGQFSDLLKYDNPLIYGKNTMLGVVAVEFDPSGKLLVFYQNGTSRTFNYRHWILSDKKLDFKFQKLEGFLTYKYIRYFDSEEDKSQFYFMNQKKAKLFQVWNAREAALLLHGITFFKGLKPEDLGVLSFDIESAGLNHDKDSEVFLITNTFEKNKIRTHKHFRLDNYSNSGEMIEDWCNWVREINPDILTGWNFLSYDLPYLNFVSKKFGKSLNLGRNGEEISFNKKTSEYRVDGSTSWSYNKAHVYGRQLIDGMFLAVKHDIGRKYPTWGLKVIAEFEKLKKPDRTMYDASKIRENWYIPEERERIVAYGIDDAEDSLNLYNLMINPYFYICMSVAKPFEEMMLGATGSWVNSIMVRAYLQDKRSIPEPSELGYLKGGISFGVPGIYRNVLKADLKSAYPSQVLRFKLYDPNKDPDAYFYKMVKYFAEQRFYYKKMEKETGDKNWEYLNSSAKVFINSAYGALSTNGLHFNSPELARKITYETRQVIIQAVEWASGKGIKYWFPEYEEDK